MRWPTTKWSRREKKQSAPGEIGDCIAPGFQFKARTEHNLTLMQQRMRLMEPRRSEGKKDESWVNQLWDGLKNFFYGKDGENMYKEKVVVIGVNGWALFGGTFSNDQKTTSLKLASMLAQAFESRHDVQVTFIGCHGYNKVNERVNQILEIQLLPLKKVIAEADRIVFSAHSQGAIVAILLLEAMIDRGWLRPGAVTNLLSMAGVHHGPFIDNPTDTFEATAELFELARGYTDISIQVDRALEDLLEKGLKVLFVASWMDQVVPLYSSLCLGHGSSTNVLRALMVHRDAGDSFLVRFCCVLVYLANAGFESDLLVHISGLVRSSIVSSNAHSLVHEEPEIYALAVQFFTQSLKIEGMGTGKKTKLVRWSPLLNHSFYKSEVNGFIIVREVEELFRLDFVNCEVKRIVQTELEGLQKEFEMWQPQGSALNHLKNLLGKSEPFRSINAKL